MENHESSGARMVRDIHTPRASVKQDATAGRTRAASPESSASSATTQPSVKIDIENVNFYYGKVKALKDITLAVPATQVTAFIGPSGCGKSTLLRSLNRMNDLIHGTRVEGRIQLD